MNLLMFLYFLGNLLNLIPSFGYLLVDILGIYAVLSEDQSNALYLFLALLFLVDSFFYWWAFEVSLKGMDYPRGHSISWVGRKAEAWNVVGSLGYVMAAIIPYFRSDFDSWKLIQIIQMVSMFVYVVDSIMYYLHALLMKYSPGNGMEGDSFYPSVNAEGEGAQWRWYYFLNVSKETKDIYFWTHLTNILGSLAYLVATIVGLALYYDLKQDCENMLPDKEDCIDSLEDLIYSDDIKSIRLVASWGDVLFFLSAFLLMVGWYHEWADSDLTFPQSEHNEDDEEEDLMSKDAKDE
ncbi:hypothetical protein QOT17_011334 [Balamuthia mandrillaris]